MLRVASLVLLALSLAACRSAEDRIRLAVSRGTGLVQLPDGVVEITAEIPIPDGAHNLEIRGGIETILRVSPRFQGRSVFSAHNADRLTLRRFTIDGNRRALEKPTELIPSENAFRLCYNFNGLLFDQVRNLDIAGVRFREIVNFPILVSRSSAVRIEHVSISDSGSRNAKGRNNGTGGILLEEGVSDFQVSYSEFRNIRGNALWTHSLYTSPRNKDGIFAHNYFDTIGRDAIQIGHATRIRVEHNRGIRIGYPENLYDAATEAVPVAVDTAGNVDQTSYSGNRFEEINGKCFDLDGFHDGEVRANTCVNRRPAEDYQTGHFALVMNNNNPNMHSENIRIVGNTFDGAKFGALYIIGTGHQILDNRLLNLNLAHCNENAARFGCIYRKDEPNLLQAGIYLGAGILRRQRTAGNTIRGNVISGYKMRTRCIMAAPGVSLRQNTIDHNRCLDTPQTRHKAPKNTRGGVPKNPPSPRR